MADLAPLDPFTLIKPRSQPDDPLGYLWQQVGNVGRATVGVPLVNTNPRPVLGQQYPDAWALMPPVAGMLSPYLAARDAATSLSEANRAAAGGDVWGAAKNLGLGALDMAAILPLGRAAKPVRLAMDEASRLARADAMGFRRSEPILVGTASANERVSSAAVKGADGTIYTAPSHFEAGDKLSAKLGREITDADLAPDWSGFLTTDGRYVSRYEAQQIAGAIGQRRMSSGPNRFEARFGLTAQDVLPAGKIRPSKTQVAASETGLPGLEGLWGRLHSPLPDPAIPTGGTAATSRTATGAVPAVYRTNRQGNLDAKGLSTEELQSSLVGAWEAGFDSARITNYIRPGGTTPETVIVLKNKNQARAPHARFDPAKKDSANLLAGILPLVSFGTLMPFAPEEDP